ncbi:MAG: hypothetical protein HY786_06930 [Deltaproteobacteria bacterium]|nr:hypothetical protein [Deltaproteobacteria bacterium]
MKNSKYSTSDVKKQCENKLDIEFRSGGEFNGWFWLDNMKVARITVPKGRKPIPPKTYKSMATQLKISIEDFDDLLECPLTKDKYEKKLRALNQQ